MSVHIRRGYNAAVFGRARSLASLVRWLGPWTDAEKLPTNISRREVVIDRDHTLGEYRGWLYSPAQGARGSYLVAPGLHYDGPADPRIDRFCRIMAASGFVVLAPFLPDFVAMHVRERVIDDLASAFEWLSSFEERPPTHPAVFSISFGSLPALRLAANPRWSKKLSHLICFGGYGDFGDTLEFCLTGEANNLSNPPPRDPLNQPAVFINLLEHLDELPGDRTKLVGAWLRYMQATWGRPEMKVPEAYSLVANEIAAELDEQTREGFLIGTGLRPGALVLCRAALAKLGASASFLDPRPYIEAIERPVYLVHGTDDDVIPFTQAELLASAFPQSKPARVLLTGLYDHTRPARLEGGYFERGGLIAKEGASMLAIASALASDQPKSS